MGGRAPLSCPAGDCHAITEKRGKICGRFTQNLVGLFEFAVLAFEGLHLLGHLGRDAATLASINLDLLDSVVQRLRRTANLR